jgi:hypothetical protein
VVVFPALYSDGLSRFRLVPSGTGLRRPFVSDGRFLVTVRLLEERAKLVTGDFH